MGQNLFKATNKDKRRTFFEGLLAGFELVLGHWVEPCYSPRQAPIQSHQERP